MCGIFAAVARVPEAEAQIGTATHIGLQTLQHRGVDGAGISVFCNGSIDTYKAMGTVKQVFVPDVTDEAIVRFVSNKSGEVSFNEVVQFLGDWRVDQHNLYRDGEESAVVNPPEKIKGSATIGHVRYATHGGSGNRNLHPIPFEFQEKPGSIAHNGELKGLDNLRGVIAEREPHFSFEGDTDTELIAALLATSRELVFESALRETLLLLEGSFSLVILYDGVVYAVRDQFANRPLVVGFNNEYLFASSETCSFDAFPGVVEENIQEVAPGSVWRLDTTFPIGSLSATAARWAPEEAVERRSCVFENIYLSRPDSMIGGVSISSERIAMGRQLAREHPITDADVVVPVIDSGRGAAIGYAEELGCLVYREALVRGRVEERTFIQPDQSIREYLQRLKLNPVKDQVRGLHVVLVDDSIVRGTTTLRLIDRVREAGASRVSIVIASPPILYTCHLGVNTPDRDELIAPDRSVEEIREMIGADYLGYLSLEGMYEAIKKDETIQEARSRFCDGCLTGEYPVSPEEPAIAS